MKFIYHLFYRRCITRILIVVVIYSVVWVVHEMLVWVCRYCDYSLSYILITGNRYFTTNDDIQIVIDRLETFFKQDIDIVQKNIEKLPWIKQVSIRKQWPDTLKVHLVEYIPKAYWNDDLILSTEGIIFEVSKYQKNLDNFNDMQIPVLYGPIGREQDVLYNYLVFSEMLKPIKLQIKSVKMDVCCSWQLVLKDNICLRLGINNIVERLLYFIKIYPFLFQRIHEQNKCIDYIDLRYKSGVAVKWINNSIISDF